MTIVKTYIASLIAKARKIKERTDNFNPKLKSMSFHQYSLWQYGLWSFQMGGTKLESFLPKNQHTQRKLLNFENWVNGEVSKIGHHFSK